MIPPLAEDDETTRVVRKPLDFLLNDAPTVVGQIPPHVLRLSARPPLVTVPARSQTVDLRSFVWLLAGIAVMAFLVAFTLSQLLVSH